MPEEKTHPKPKPGRKPFGWQFWLFLAVVIVLLAGLTDPKVISGPKKAPQTEATNNLRQIGLALSVFEDEFGEFPNEDTAALVIMRHSGSSHGLNGSSSNALFRQLFAAEIIQSEVMFYARVPGVRKPDGVITPGKILQKGEVGFAYIAGLSSAGNPNRPIAFAPVIPGTRRFDPKPFEGNAVFLRIDNSVVSMKIRKDGHVHLDGIDILSPEHPIWDGKAPDIRYPE
jgi:hypothetical protein